MSSRELLDPGTGSGGSGGGDDGGDDGGENTLPSFGSLPGVPDVLTDLGASARTLLRNPQDFVLGTILRAIVRIVLNVGAWVVAGIFVVAGIRTRLPSGETIDSFGVVDITVRLADLVLDVTGGLTSSVIGLVTGLNRTIIGITETAAAPAAPIVAVALVAAEVILVLWIAVQLVGIIRTLLVDTLNPL
jgi:hypothetical protein